MKDLLKAVSEIITNKSFIKMILSGKRKKTQDFQKVVIRPVIIKEKIKYQIEYFYEKKVTHENNELNDTINRIVELIKDNFKQINAVTEDSDIQILAAKPEKPRIIKRENVNCCRNSSIDYKNNKKKNYIIEDNKPCDFLIKLGVMSPEGKVYNNYYSKFRQINRFLEILDDTYKYLKTDTKTDNKKQNIENLNKDIINDRSTIENSINNSIKKDKNRRKKDFDQNEVLRIIDFGCGKAYLTFAVYYYFVKIKHRNVEIIGLDLKRDVIEFCSKTAEELNYEGLEFICGDIADYTSDRADIVLTLHACDTATDYALINAVNWGAKVILSVPCCQHELFKMISNPVMKPMLKHGIIKDKFTELLTDGLRGLKLEEYGYNVSMIEFTSLEHTSKNIMIKAVKEKNKNRSKIEKAGKEYEDLKEMFNVFPTIDKL